MVEKKFPGARVSISDLNDGLTRGILWVVDADLPPRPFFFNDTGGLSEFTLLSPQIDPAQLGSTHLERGWADGIPVAVTLPPAESHSSALW